MKSGPEDTVWDVVATPIGKLTLRGGSEGLRAIGFPGRAADLDDSRRDRAALATASGQLREYFAGERRAFDLDLDLVGDELSLRVWAELLTIPFGTTISYGELGERAGHADPRDIGACVGSTPVPIVVPCHRVIAADGSLRGYGGGLDRKRFLLALEHRGVAPDATLPAWAHSQLALL